MNTLPVRLGAGYCFRRAWGIKIILFEALDIFF